MIIEQGNVHVAVQTGDQDAWFPSRDATVGEVPAAASPLSGTRRASIEFYRRVGGSPQRALLGGTMTWSTSNSLKVEVLTSGGIAVDAAPEYGGSLRHPLVPGLPDEFGATVAASLLEAATQAGTIVVDRAAYDPVESSSAAFGAAAALLAVVLNVPHQQDAEALVRAKLQELPR